MKRWALIENESNIVRNVILWDGVSVWSPQDDVYLIECDGDENAQPGAVYENGIFLIPVPVEEPELTANNEVTTEPTVL
jgi:hypothetical protein